MKIKKNTEENSKFLAFKNLEGSLLWNFLQNTISLKEEDLIKSFIEEKQERKYKLNEEKGIASALKSTYFQKNLSLNSCKAIAVKRETSNKKWYRLQTQFHEAPNQNFSSVQFFYKIL